MIVISAGFDATSGHPSALGGYTVTPAMFGYMTKQLGRLCNDRLVLVLEGGYDLASVCDCAEESVKVLCGEAPTPFSDKSLKARPNPAAVSTLKSVVDVQKKFWPGLRDDSLESSQWEWEGIAARKKFASLSVASNSCDTADLNGDLTSETTAVAKEEKEKLTAGTVNGATEAPKECRVGVIKSTKQLVEEQSHSDSMAILTPNNTAVTAGGLEVMDQT